MKIDIAGRIRNTRLAYRNCLQPLYEGVINSFHAIEDKGNDNGRIEIKIYRSGQMTIEGQERYLEPVMSFEIKDNGIGFDDTNYESFLTADTPLKTERGGKGVGRFIWLKAFGQAKVESTFKQNGKYFIRKFDFKCTRDGIENVSVKEVNGNFETGTTVVLTDFKRRYQELCPKTSSIIARRLVEHSLEYFLLKNPPTIILIDDQFNERVDLNEIFNQDFKPSSKPKQFFLNGHSFAVQDVLITKPYDPSHKAHYCAHRRVVVSESLTNKVPHLDCALNDENGCAFAYAAYVSSDYLDDKVESDRTEFRIGAKPDPMFSSEISWQDIHNDVYENAKLFLEPYTQKSKEQAIERFENYVQFEAPKYRHLLSSRKEAIEDLSPNLTNQNLELELHKLHYDVTLQLKKEAIEQLAQNDSENETEWETHREGFKKLFRQLNEVAKSELADYVVHRKTVLSFLEKMMGISGDKKYAKEEAIHEIIFPLRSTSDEIDYENHNLWIINESLVYHKYLASDLQFNQQIDSPSVVDSLDRPDILIFNKAFALVEGDFPFNSVVIIEFKRPERIDYNEDKSPIRQVLKYVSQIRESRAKDRRGHTIQINSTIPFYCYIIATLTPSLIDEAQYHDLTPAPDASGYFGYNKHYRSYIEVISFDKLIADAKKRNRAFFDKLNLS